MKNKARISDWISEVGLICIADWARNGFTKKQIADKMGICRATLYKWEKASEDLRNSIAQNNQVVDGAVENSLLQNALNGDTTACIFWLKNRRPKSWRDKQVVETQKTLLMEIIENHADEISNENYGLDKDDWNV